MLRFLHSSDWHLTQGKFFEETLRCLEFIADVARRERVDTLLLPGDLSHSDLPHRVMAPMERNALADVLDRFEAKRMVPGNHDIAGDLRPFTWLQGASVYERAEFVGNAGNFDFMDILAVPYPSKRHWQAARDTVGVETARQALGDQLSAALRGLAKARRPDRPLIGLAHLNIAGSTVGGGEVLIGQEIELTPADLDEIGCDYWALGHIHQPQQVAERAWYCGTPQPHSFGDSNVNGFNLVEIEGPGKPPRVTFIETPAVKLYTLRAQWTGKDGWAIQYNPDDQNPGAAHLRIVATVEESERETAAWDRLDKLVEHYRPRSVKIERRIIPTTRVRSEAIRAAHTVDEKLAAFWGTLSPPPAADERERAVELLHEIA